MGRLACLEREGEVGWERLGHLRNAMVAMTEEVKKLDKGYDAMRGGWLETNRLVSGLRVGQLQLEAARPRVGLPFPRPSGGPDAPPVEGGLHPGLVSGREEVLGLHRKVQFLELRLEEETTARDVAVSRLWEALRAQQEAILQLQPSLESGGGGISGRLLSDGERFGVKVETKKDKGVAC